MANIQVAIDLSEKQVKFLKWMINDMRKFENITTVEEAVRECINMAMFDEGEISAAQEGM